MQPVQHVVKRVQRQWQNIVNYDRVRQGALKKMWDNRVVEMCRNVEGKNKRQQAFARKLKLISPETRDKILKKYFFEAKTKHLALFHKWMRAYGSLSHVRLLLMCTRTRRRQRQCCASYPGR